LFRPKLDELWCIKTLRFLVLDVVQTFKVGHPELPLGMAAMACAIWDRLLKVNPSDHPLWPDEDCCLLSAARHIRPRKVWRPACSDWIDP
jgi:transketolase